jgi:hypothetical protein
MLEELKAYIKDRFSQEFAAQGHHLTGAAEDSVTFKDKITNQKINIEVWANYYVKFVDKGVRPDEIKSPYAPPRIEGLTRFWKLRKGLSDKEAKSAAYATATKHAQEGMPTSGSFRYSKTGKRTGFTQELTDTKTVSKMGELISKEVYNAINANIQNMIKESNTKIK